jgi:cell wall-associated NlpC family hydrolase
MQGVPYVYGGDTPSGFDCSGLIYWASQQLGITGMPRDTYAMLGQGVSNGTLVPTSNPQTGDLAFFGSGHVEIYIKSGQTFGAQQPGTNVGFHSYGYGYVPTAFYSIH